MKKWIAKAILQKTISYLPFSNSINFFFQKYISKAVELNDDYFFDRLKHAKEHLEIYKKYTQKEYPESVLELGTGWYPVVPICMFLSGSETIYTLDIAPLCNKERLKVTLLKFRDSINNTTISNFLTIDSSRILQFEKLLNKFDDLPIENIFNELKIKYLLQDARNLNLPNNSVDFIVSNNTFEHIYPEILEGILLEMKRIVSNPNGILSHIVDMTDHFAHSDKTITHYNFLQFSDKQWKRIDNSIQPMNRMRVYEYVALYERLQIPTSEIINTAGNLEELKTVELNSKYKSKPIIETAFYYTHIVSVF